MHNSPINQAAGLMGINQSQRPRLTAFVSHGDAASELPLLWKLCAAMVDLGYSVTVLDGTAPETGHNPGLEQVLDYTVVDANGAELQRSSERLVLYMQDPQPFAEAAGFELDRPPIDQGGDGDIWVFRKGQVAQASRDQIRGGHEAKP